MKHLAIIILLSFCQQRSFAQEPPVNTQQQLENAAEAMEEEANKDDNYLQILDFYSRNRLNLNTVTAEELQPLRLITDLQIANLISYRRTLGNFLSIYELQAVPTLDLLSIGKIEPYIYVGPAVSVRDALRSRFSGGDGQLLGRVTRVLERSRGYDTTLRTHYLGDPNRVLLRYRYQFKNLLYYGIVADKDAGEQFFKGAQKQGFDFYSVHLFARNIGRIKSIAVGDYLANFGQGLIQWQSMAFGKSAEVTNIKRQSPTLMPYRSASEFYFNRGVGATIDFGKIHLTAFASIKKLSGNYIMDTVERFSSFQTSGYYRTQSEVADRYNLTDVSMGASVAYVRGGFKMALNSVHHQFSLPLQKRADAYNYFAASGTTMLNNSIDYGYTYKNIHLFGEAAIDKHRNLAVVNGALVSVDSKVDVSLFYRNISKAYQSFFGNAFTENTLPSNEQGFYTGFVIRPVYRWTISAYADFYNFPFLRYRVNAPTVGRDYLVQLTYVPRKKSEVYIRYRSENKPINESGTSWPLNYPVDKIRQNLRLHFSSQVNSMLNIRTRAELLWFDRRGNNSQQGFLSYIEGVFKPNFSLSTNVRLQYFETGGYDSRIYAYESDVLYSYSIPAFFDKGFRYYVNINYDVTRHFTVWLRYAQSAFRNKNTVGSGLDLINGSKKSELKFQFAWKF